MFDEGDSKDVCHQVVGPNPQGHGRRKLTLEDLYVEFQAAAETYQVLQVGITCVEEDREKGCEQGELFFARLHGRPRVARP